ncbi:MAG: hypothetical protein H7144_09515 [Burkholderiales bacterium]|nr:hypothetical protein [Phycisphaerae bacterium]
MLATCGCGPKNLASPAVPAGAWDWQNLHGQGFETPHYAIYTTVRDDAVVQRFAATMEAAHAKYEQLVPRRLSGDRRLKIYLFAEHSEWAAYTVATTGKDSEAYLSVFTGGYTIRDEFVCWMGTELDTLGVAAHEGFHQFVARHFHSRLPPTLEEGLATTFENISISDTAVTINTTANGRRQLALRRAIDENYLIPFDTFIQLHAGDLAGRSPELIEAFYAQAWALARLLRDEPGYRLGFMQMMKDIAAGSQLLDIGPGDGSQVYYPSRVRPVLQRYVAPDWSKFTADYDAFIRRVARQPVEQ